MKYNKKPFYTYLREKKSVEKLCITPDGCLTKSNCETADVL